MIERERVRAQLQKLQYELNDLEIEEMKFKRQQAALRKRIEILEENRKKLIAELSE